MEKPNGATVLLVEDSKDSQLLVKRALEGEAEVTVAPDLSAACRLLDVNEFDVLLLDMNLPDGSGLDLFARFGREAPTCRPRVIILTASVEMSFKLAGFSMGADDYIVKPVNPMELRARVRSHLRVRQEMIDASQVFRVGDLKFNPAKGVVETIGEAGVTILETTPTEFRILSVLAKSVGRILTRGQLRSSLPRWETNADDRVIDVHVSHLRPRLAPHGFSIESIYGFGYRLIERKAS